MSILSGFKKVKRYIKLPDGYKKLSIWTSSQTVEMDDGTTLESNKTKWDDASNKKHEHSNKDALDSITSNNITKWNDMSTNIDATIALKANQSELETHINDNTIHITADERTKLSGIATGANKYTHPSSAAGAKNSGLYKIITDANGHVTGATAVTKTDITALGIPASDTNTTYGTGTASVSGLTKLYASTGTSTDGTMTRDAITSVIRDLVIKRHTKHTSVITIDGNWDQIVDITVPQISGYKYLAALPGSGCSDVSLCEILYISDTITRVRYKNHRVSAVTFIPSINVLYIKTL